jgi:TM2 domain-containing membrane protein YozV
MSEWYPASGSALEMDGIYIGDADRSEATQLLGDHFHCGRLDADEYGHRLQMTLSARTRGQLRAVFAPLPSPWPSCLHPASQAYPAPQAAFPTTQPVALSMQPAVPTMLVAPVLPLGPSDKSRVAAGLLQIFLPFGVGRFYTGHAGLGVAQLLLVAITCGIAALWPIIDGIVLLAAGGTDSLGRRLR